MLRAGMLAVAVLLATASAAPAVTYTVNSGANAGDLTCDATCTLRDAIDDSNASTTVDDEIVFTASLTVLPTAALPAITDTVTINGSDDDACTGAYQQVALDGNGGAFVGLQLDTNSTGSRICALNIRGFTDGINVRSASNTIDLCRIGTGVAGEAANANTDGIDIETAGDNNTIRGNVLSGNTVAGVRMFNTSTGNVIVGNFIGTDDDGEEPVGNQVGVILDGGSTLGGTTAADRNVISGNTGSGVDALNGVVAGNHIGTDDDGLEAIANGLYGVIVDGPLVTVGGSTPASRNLISGNTDSAVLFVDNGSVRNNWIGPAADGVTFLGGQSDAVAVTASGATIADNVIGGHSHYGIYTDDPVNGVTIRDNVIGLAPDGVTAGVGDEGIDLDFETTNALVEGNTIAGNGGSGIEVESDDTTIVGNTIGLDATGAATDDTANDEAIDVISGAENTMIGGPDAGDGNRLSNSDTGGVQVFSGSTGTTVEGNVIDGNDEEGVKVTGTGVAEIKANSIHSNGTIAGDLGIDLAGDGITANDPGDADSGPNGLQNFPVITKAETDGATTDVDVTLDTTPGHTITIEVFANDACSTSGNGEGETFLGRAQVVAGSGPVGHSLTVGGTSGGKPITATATDEDVAGDPTSEFSACFSATQAPVQPDPDPEPAPATTEETSPPPPAIVPLPPLVLPPPRAPKLPAKVAVLRNGVDDGVLDMLIQITSRAESPGAALELDYQSSGRHTRFEVPIDGTQIRVRKKLPKSQPKDTGIVEIEYDGNDVVASDEVRLRAADGKSKLKRTKSEIVGGRLDVEGTVNRAARGVVRIRLGYDLPSGETGLIFWNAKISKGKWKIDKALPAEAASGGQLSIQFTGYEKKNLRGEQIAKQVLA